VGGEFRRSHVLKLKKGKKFQRHPLTSVLRRGDRIHAHALLDKGEGGRTGKRRSER